MTNKAMNTLKAIVESGMVPNEQGTPVAPPTYITKAYNCADEYSDNSGYDKASDALYNAAGKADDMSWTHGQTSKQYTPSGAHEWGEPEKRYPLKFWILLAVACVSGATLGAVVPLEFVQGAF